MNKNQMRLKDKSMSYLIEHITDLTEGKKKFITESSKPYAKEMGDRLGLSPMHATILAIYINQSDQSSIPLREIADHFGLKIIKMLDQLDIIYELVDHKLLTRKRERNGSEFFYIKPQVVRNLSKGILPEVKKMDNLNIDKFLDEIFNLLDSRLDEEIEDEELYDSLHEIIKVNPQLSLARQLKDIALDDSSLVLFLAMSMKFICFDDNRIMRSDIEDYLPRVERPCHFRELERGEHILMTKNLVEHTCENGQADPKEWKLTDHAKLDVFSELKLTVIADLPAGLTRYTTIMEKDLFYNDNVSKQVSRLESLLDQSRMADILNSMEKHGMRKGFTCLFYGSPGTGKTETVLQLARRTKRDIMMVDIPSIRSKWVGDTEKNIKAIFDRYKLAVTKNATAPILLFNEADALFTRRKEGGTDSIDKMENAMQNIILQELENLEGILIATTNLSGSLDDAFERRFLYKIEFEKPLPEQRMHIWKAMLPDLNDTDANTLAGKYDFSGGQIENIARKRIVNDILDCREDIDLQSIIESCENERIVQKKSAGRQIGFN